MDSVKNGRVNSDINAELEHHLELRARELIDQGWEPAAAREEARRRFGNVDNIRRNLHEIDHTEDRQRHLSWVLSGMRQDVTVGMRRLLRSPGFAAVAILTLALGIGATSAIFSVLNAVVIAPLAFHEPDRLVQVWESSPGRGWDYFAMSQPNYLDYRDNAQAFDNLTAVGFGTFNLTGTDEPERLTTYRVTSNFFATLGVDPLMGRGFTAEEDAFGSMDRVVMVSSGFWRGRLGGDPDIVGSTLELNGESFQVIGVVPHRSAWFFQVELFMPLRPNPDDNRSDHRLSIFGRLPAGVTVEQAEADLDAFSAVLAEKYPESNRGFDTRVMSLHDAIVSTDMQNALMILLGAVGFVLLIACANISNLLLARAAGRQREIAIYSALGASRGRIAGQLLTESVLLGILGGGLGILLAWQSIAIFQSLDLNRLPRFDTIQLDATVLGFALLVSLVAGVASGLAPAWQVAGGDLQDALKEGGRGTASGRTARTRKILMATEVALSIVLLAGAMLLMRSFWQVQRVDPGMEVDRVLTMSVNFPVRPDIERGDLGNFYRGLIEQVAAVPGVESAAGISGLPFGGGATSMDYVIEGEDLNPDGGAPSSFWRLITPDYFKTAGIPLQRGRFFTDADGVESPNIAIISASMAEDAWPGENPVGKRFHGWRDPERLMEVVGVVGDVRERSLEQEGMGIVYLPFYRNDFWPDMYVLTRSAGEPGDVADGVRTAINRYAADIPIAHMRSMRDVMDDTLSGRRFNTVLIGTFAAIALLLAAAGVYGVMAYSVAQRSGEIGIRMAMGARARQVVMMVMTQGMRVVTIGGVVGIVLAYAVTRLLSSMLFGVQADDPLSFVAAAVFLIGVALLACAIPAYRATRVDPVQTLRND
jgi:putative ABC transport system permease protein